MSRSHNVRYDMKRIVESAMLNRLPRLYTFLTSSARYWAYYHLRTDVPHFSMMIWPPTSPGHRFAAWDRPDVAA